MQLSIVGVVVGDFELSYHIHTEQNKLQNGPKWENGKFQLMEVQHQLSNLKMTKGDLIRPRLRVPCRHRWHEKRPRAFGLAGREWTSHLFSGLGL